MFKTICCLAIFALSGMALLFAQTSNTTKGDTSWYSGNTAPHHALDYDKKTPPVLSMSDAYILALKKLGADTNRYYCLSATCLISFPLASSSGSNSSQGWAFDFANTNGVEKKILVGFDKLVWVENM
jgi:hypothetical protein